MGELTYAVLCIPFLLISAAAAVTARRAHLRRRASGSVHAEARPRDLVVAAALAMGVLFVLTAIFDNVIIGIGLVAYDESVISGLRIGRAPIEDFAYPWRV
ncbi:lycopene cyclase domain-containing protein [Nesterenkonia pannonica]|uniref:lycopene cyclase domain-containing protein n=1 Tax=Nesterenkonia pannonica TaxID=1548602 RepID=UPI0021640B2F|nr:lycopene cyclase domain-containing protein [Nesterenkonia pannonica]